MTTIDKLKEEFEKLLNNLAHKVTDEKSASEAIETIYQWHIQQQIKLLEEVKKEIIGEDNGGTGHVYFYKKQLRKDLDSKITNLKKEL